MMVMLKHPRTGDFKALDVGWNWTFFLFSGVLGIPLFMKGLTAWGAVVVFLWCLDLALPFIAPAAAGPGFLGLAPALALGGLCLFFATKGNGMLAKKYLARGYDFAKPDSAEARYAKEKWSLEY